MKQEPWSLTGRLRQVTSFCLTLIGLAFLVIYGSKALSQIDDLSAVTGVREHVAITPSGQLALTEQASPSLVFPADHAVASSSEPESVSSPQATPPAQARGVSVNKSNFVDYKAHNHSQQQAVKSQTDRPTKDK